MRRQARISIELGVPFSDPLADGPAIQAAGQRALEAGATFERVLEEVAAPPCAGGPGGADVLREPADGARARRRPSALIAERGVVGADRPGHAGRGGGRAARRVRRGRGRAGAARRSHDASRRGAADRRVRARVRLRRVGDRRHRRARRAAARAGRGRRAGPRSRPMSRSRSDSASARRNRSPRWARSRTG